MFSVALRAPTLVGEKKTVTVVDAPAATSASAGASTLKSAAFVPVMVNGVAKVMVVPPMFSIVTVDDVEVPAAIEPKSTAAGLSATDGVDGLDEFCGELTSRSTKSSLLMSVSTEAPSNPPARRS